MLESDILTYITHRLSCGESRDMTELDQSAIKENLCNRGQSLFLYARLMLDGIMDKSEPINVQLKRLPGSLTEMYKGLLRERSRRCGVPPKFQSTILSRVTHCYRPLRLAEMAALISSHDNRCGLNNNHDAKMMVRVSCGPLLEVRDGETVQVIHHTFTEFLLDVNKEHGHDTENSSNEYPPSNQVLSIAR
jgi:hypothetical protein